MKTFQEKFKDHIDMYHGTAIVNEPIYRDIQKDALERALQIFSETMSGHSFEYKDPIAAIRKEIDSLSNIPI